MRLVRASLVGSQLGFAVTIAWADPSRRRAISPTDDVTAADVAIWWQDLPADEIRAEEVRPAVAPFDLTRFAMAIRVAVKVWPHVRVTITVRRDLDDDGVAAVARRFVEAQAAWNRSPVRAGTIHLVGEARRLDARRLTLDLDLGSAGPPALEHLLDLLDATGDVSSVDVISG